MVPLLDQLLNRPLLRELPHFEGGAAAHVGVGQVAPVVVVRVPALGGLVLVVFEKL